MAGPRTFDWDPAKAAANLTKHGVRFEVAVSVFSDAEAVTEDVGPDAYGGRRVRVTGVADRRVISVFATEREGVTRLISARPASRKERHGYRQVRT